MSYKAYHMWLGSWHPFQNWLCLITSWLQSQKVYLPCASVDHRTEKHDLYTGIITCLEQDSQNANLVDRSNIAISMPFEILEVCQLKNLTVLEVINNQLTCLPAELSKCINLMRLVVDRNKLYWLPHELCRLVHLMELSATGNRLLCVPLGRRWFTIL